ncbi:MAG: hypothetical protein KAJ45_06860, partial [Desulfobulbaceae bacterium]|nr:hypothetical protein [Desulfobulbaceae bacterium]
MENNETNKMEEMNSGVPESDVAEMSFAELFDDTVKVVKVGEVVLGTVVGLTDGMVMMDIGDKSESLIPIR